MQWANYNFNYWGGATQAFSKTCDLSKGAMYPCDQSIFVAPPGRFPNGNSTSGHSDLAGNVFNMTPDFNGTDANGYKKYYWSQSGSWEGHGIPYGNATFPVFNKYLAAGARCVRP